MCTSFVGVSPLLLGAVIVALAAVTDSYGCPSGCVCKASGGVMTKALCFNRWLGYEPPLFPETINKIEFRDLFYHDIIPYLSGAPKLLSLDIQPSFTKGASSRLPNGFLDAQSDLQSLSIRLTKDFQIPQGMARAIEPLDDLVKFNVWGNRMRCDCALPDELFKSGVKMKVQYRVPAVRDCKASDGFRYNKYKANDFLRECARIGGYTLRKISDILEVRSRKNSVMKAKLMFQRTIGRRVSFTRRYGRAAGDDPLLADEGKDDFSSNNTEDAGSASQNGMEQMDIADELDQETADQQDEAELRSTDEQEGDQDEQVAILETGSPRRDQSKSLTPEQMQLALYQLQTNDLTIRLNPYDPFEVDLFFQYVLHEENKPKLNIEKLKEL